MSRGFHKKVKRKTSQEILLQSKKERKKRNKLKVFGEEE